MESKETIARGSMELGCDTYGAGAILAKRFGKSMSDVSKVKKGIRGIVAEPTYSQIRLAMLEEFGGYVVIKKKIS